MCSDKIKALEVVGEAARAFLTAKQHERADCEIKLYHAVCFAIDNRHLELPSSTHSLGTFVERAKQSGTE